MGRTKKQHDSQARLEQRQAILAALARASADVSPSGGRPVPDDDGEEGYYSLTPGQMEALLSGNLAEIESWVSNLDQRHATWLLRWLIKEGR